MHRRWPRRLAATAFVSFLLAPRAATAQAGLPHLEDATVAPKGALRLRAIASWTRFDARFTDAGVEPLGAMFTADSLGSARLAALAPSESAIASATGSAFTLSLGRSRLDARGREEIVPVGLEYGLTNRVTVGVIVPIVRRRLAVQFRLDSAGANVGSNLHRTSPAARQTNSQLQTEFASAAAQLQVRLQGCRANPAGAGCAALLAREAEANQLITESQTFAGALAALYGSETAAGMPFVPLSASPAQAAVDGRVADFNARYRDMLGATADLILARPVAAGGPVGSAEFQGYLTDELARDSITTEERSGIGDVEVGVKALVLDRPAAPSNPLGIQLAVAAAARLPTGSRDSPSEIADLTLGGGTAAVDARAALDLKLGRFGALVVGDALFALETQPTASLDAPLPAQRDSRIVGIHVAPRWHLSNPLSFHLAYTFRSGDVSEAQQLVGGGVSVSTLSAYRAAGGALPLEMRFTHLEALTGIAGSPKFFSDRIEVRIYYRLFRR
jgi:hypothetical protein